MANSRNERLRTTEDMVLGLRNWSDDQTWRQFLDDYRRLLWAEARKSGLDPVECDEVVQDTLLTVAKGIAGFKYDPNRPGFRTWLRRIARCRIIDRARKKARERRLFVPQTEAICERLRQRAWKSSASHETTLTPEHPWPALATRGCPEWETTENPQDEDVHEILDEAISQLQQQANPWHFQVFQHLLQGQKPREVSRTLGVSRVAIYVIKKRLQRKLQELVRSAAQPPG